MLLNTGHPESVSVVSANSKSIAPIPAININHNHSANMQILLGLLMMVAMVAVDACENLIRTMSLIVYWGIKIIHIV